LFYYLLSASFFRNLLIISLAAVFATLMVLSSNYQEYSENIFISSFGLFMIASSGFIKGVVFVKDSIYIYLCFLAIVIFVIVSYILNIRFGAKLQVVSVSFVLLIMIAETKIRKYIAVFLIVVAGGRSITAGAIYAYFVLKKPIFHKILSLIILAAISWLIMSGVLFDYFMSYLNFLRDSGELLKGRTNYWINLLLINPTWFGYGAGTSVHIVSDLVGEFHLPHGDLLRVIVDYGIFSLLILLGSLWWNSMRSPFSLLLSSVLVFYMVTGNPLNFPVVISTYLLSSILKNSKEYHNDGATQP